MSEVDREDWARRVSLWQKLRCGNPEEDMEKGKPRWRMLFIGFLLGVLVSFLALVIIALKWGPRGESVEVDLYSGHRIIYRHFFSKRSRIPGPKLAHVRWAIQHQNPVRSWYRVGSSMSRPGWFGKMMAVSYITREYVYEIYSLEIPEEEKIKLLHQYHKELDALKVKESELRKSFDYMESFYKDWEQKLEKIRNERNS